MQKMIINVRDFSKTPGARYRDDGNSSGQEFYEDYLKQAYEEALRTNEKLTIDLDGTEGYATSFLDEAFGRLAAEFGPNDVIENIIIISNDEPDWIEEIKSYILER